MVCLMVLTRTEKCFAILSFLVLVSLSLYGRKQILARRPSLADILGQYQKYDGKLLPNTLMVSIFPKDSGETKAIQREAEVSLALPPGFPQGTHQWVEIMGTFRKEKGGLIEVTHYVLHPWRLWKVYMSLPAVLVVFFLFARKYRWEANGLTERKRA
ncbi:MAG: hypothetical protein HY537_07560 [Deltaproteobacteria bacterium]|nr:hypothetical protein [Deltaproteobacteria bacterium]